MLKHGISYCPYCRRPFRYAGSYDRHLALKHNESNRVASRPALWITSTTGDNQADSDYEDPPLYSDEVDIQDPGPEFHDQGSGFELDRDEHDEEGTARFNGEEEDIESEPEDSAPPTVPPQATNSDPYSVMKYPGAGEPIGEAKELLAATSKLLEDPWFPFTNAHDFKQARWMIQSNLAKTHIDQYFREGLCTTDEVSFTSGWTLHRSLDRMYPELGEASWRSHDVVTVVGNTTRSIPFYYRDPVACVAYLMKQPCFRDHLVYAPIREYDPSGERMYSEMHTAEWWWNVQESLPHGSTVIPVICTSDQTHLTNFSGDKKAWPIYLTLGNIKSGIRNRPSTMAMILLALLPVPPKFKSDKAHDDQQREVNRHTLHATLEQLLLPLQVPGKNGIKLSCVDGKIRMCFPVLAAWIADHEEHVTLHNLARNSCPKCEVPPEKLGTLGTYPVRDHRAYQEAISRYELYGDTGPIDGLASIGLKALYNGLWKLPRLSMNQLHKPDLLHNVYLGLLKNLLDWITAFLKQHHRLTAFDRAWRTMPPYPGFTQPRKAFREVTQWQGKEMRNFGRIILVASAVALSFPSVSQREVFAEALKCVRSLVDFHLIAQYRSHTAETLRYLDAYLKDFHAHKGVFLHFRESKMTKKKVTAVDKKLLERFEREDHDARRTQGGKSTSRGRTTAAQRKLELARKKERERNRIAIIESESHFNYPKMHLLTHFHEHIVQFGNIPMYSTEIGESSHRTQIKEGYRHSNRNDYVHQILAHYGRHQAFHMQVENLRALTRGGKDNEELANVLGPGPEAAKSIGLRRLRGRHQGNRTLAGILKLFTDVDLSKLLVAYSQHNLQADRQLPTKEEDLLTLPVEIFKQIEIPVPSFTNPDEYTVHHARCVQNFRNQGPRNDWVWVKVADETEFGALRGRLPGRLKGLIKIRDTVSGYSHRLALVQLLSPGPGKGSVDANHGLVKVYRKLGKIGSDIWLVTISSIQGIAHIVPVDADGTNLGGKDLEAKTWLVNSRIDLETFNEIY